jgi:hypothetical protein
VGRPRFLAPAFASAAGFVAALFLAFPAAGFPTLGLLAIKISLAFSIHVPTVHISRADGTYPFHLYNFSGPAKFVTYRIDLYTGSFSPGFPICRGERIPGNTSFPPLSPFSGGYGHN